MKRILFLTLLVACSKDSSGPAGLDPTVSFKNVSPYIVAMDWYAQSGLASHTVIRSGDSTCIIFLSTSRTDSVRFVIDDSTYRPAGTGWAKQWSPWFDPTTGITTTNAADFPLGAEYWVYVWGGKLGPAYGADSAYNSTTVAKAPCS